MRGQAKRLTRNYLTETKWREMLGKVILSYMFGFSKAQMFSGLFVRLGCRLLCGRLAVHSIGVHSVFGSLKSKPA